MHDIHLSPAEASKRLGVSPKALRLYERHGLVTPTRAANGWRAYGPAEMARLHQVLALKALGLPLSRIARLLHGKFASLDTILALQERVLGGEAERVGRALELIRTARARLAAGAALSIDDLANLTTETTMTAKPTDEEIKAIMEPLVERHFTPEDRAELAKIPYDQAEAASAWSTLIAEAKVLMDKGDVTSPEALDAARRWKALVQAFTQGKPEIEAKVKAVWSDALADPAAAPSLPINAELMAFMSRAMAHLKG